MTTKILKTENEMYGFWGTTAIHYKKQKVQERWNEAFITLKNLSGKSDEEIRICLDSRMGRHIADDCIDADVKDTILQNYFKCYEKILFEEEDKQKFVIEKDTTLFGTRVINNISGMEDIVLYTYKNPNRIYQNYAVCIDRKENKYTIRMDYITPIEE